MELYTVTQETIAELEEKKSLFIAHLVPYADFDTRLSELREAHPKANHHVTAFRWIDGNNRITESGKDDGEPSGTSGMPTLKVLIGAKLINVGVIVVRYFGGTKLGTGGLARAYSGATKQALEMADIVEWQRIVRHQVSASFAKSSDLERLISVHNLSVVDRQFDASGVTIVAEGAERDVEAFKSSI